jgi:hypothetical protein
VRVRVPEPVPQLQRAGAARWARSPPRQGRPEPRRRESRALAVRGEVRDAGPWLRVAPADAAAPRRGARGPAADMAVHARRRARSPDGCGRLGVRRPAPRALRRRRGWPPELGRRPQQVPRRAASRRQAMQALPRRDAASPWPHERVAPRVQRARRPVRAPLALPCDEPGRPVRLRSRRNDSSPRCRARCTGRGPPCS